MLLVLRFFTPTIVWRFYSSILYVYFIKFRKFLTFILEFVYTKYGTIVIMEYLRN